MQYDHVFLDHAFYRYVRQRECPYGQRHSNSHSRLKNELPFPLLGLPPHIIERIISKMKIWAYFLMQPTCKYIKDLIEQSQNIKIIFHNTLSLTWETDAEGFIRAILIFRKMRNWIIPKHGCRFGILEMPNDIPDAEQAIEAIKAHRITCMHFCIRGKSTLTKTACTALFNLLKPSNVEMYSLGSNRYEALAEAQFPRPTSLKVEVQAHQAIAAMTKILPIWHEVDLKVRGRWDRGGNDVPDATTTHSILMSALEFLYSTHLPNLRWFRAYLHFQEDGTVPTEEELWDLYGEFRPAKIRVKQFEPDEEPELCQLLASMRIEIPNGEAYCDVEMELDIIRIDYTNREIHRGRFF